MSEMLLNRYEVIDEIARGGFGVVYKARDTRSDRLVAIKRLLTDEKGPRQRFEREMTLIGKLHNPHTVQLIEFGFDDGHPVMVLELVEGEPLRQRLKRGPMAPEVARQVVCQVLASLAEAHRHGIVHRDLKPPNIMLTGPEDDPTVKLLDFGTAGVVRDQQGDDHKKITAYGEVQGTPSYMPPEQVINFGDAVTQSDIYVVGLILHECLTGQIAITGPSPLDILTAQVRKPLPMPPEVRDSHFAAIIQKATAKAVAQRYQRAEEMIADLEALDLKAPPSLPPVDERDEATTRAYAPTEANLERVAQPAPPRASPLPFILGLVVIAALVVTLFLLI